jgi:hypothetical protein
MTREKIYYALAVLGFVGTGSQVLGYLDAGPIGGTADFWRDALMTNDAARFLAIDIAVLGVAVFVLLITDARKLGIATKWVALYVVGSLLIGISTFVPLFLAHRERALRQADTAGV